MADGMQTDTGQWVAADDLGTIKVPRIKMTFGPSDTETLVSHSDPLPTGVPEFFQLLTVNVASAPVTLFGGDYIFAQTADSYGSIALDVLGPDGTTWLPLVTKTASDANGNGTGLGFGNFAQVKAVATGTTNGNATLSRLP